MSWCVGGKISKNGNSAQVTIPRTFLHRLGWLVGSGVVIELADDEQTLIVRRPQQSDFPVNIPPRVVRVTGGTT